MSQRLGLALLACMVARSTLVEAQSGWIVGVGVTEGPLTPAEVRPLLDAELPGIAECAPGAGPYQLVFNVSVGASGGVRSAAADRSVGAELAPARAVRCVRHRLEELELPVRAEASRLSVTFTLGVSEPPPIAAGPPSSAAPPASASTAPSSASVGVASVTLGPLVVTGSRAVASLRPPLETGRSALLECYEAALVVAPGLGGQGALHLTIAPEGRVVRALFAGSEALAGAMALCLGTAARAWTFPAGDDEVRLDVPLEFAGP